MNWKNRFTNYNFWISIVSAVLLILQAFEFQFDIMYINEIATAVLGLLVVIGIINDPTKTTAKKETKTEKVENVNSVKAENVNAEIKTEETPVEDKEVLDTSTNESAESLEEQTFPIDEQNETNDDTTENDFENLIEKISADINKEDFKEMFKNLLNLLKNNEKTSKNLENLQNFSRNEEVSTEIKLTETEIKPAEVFEEKKEIITENFEEKAETLDVLNVEVAKEIKTENNIQPVKETEVQASSFNIVN